MDQNDLNTLLTINKRLESAESQTAVKQAQVHNPSQEMTTALTDFVTARLEKISDNESFDDLLKMHLRQRLPEASFDQLMQLHHETSQDNNAAVETLLKLFRNESSGKTIIEHVKDNDISTISDTLYKNAGDKKILQAVTYLGQIMAQMQAEDSEFEVVDTTN